MDIFGCSLTVVAAYFLGSIPFGYLVARSKGVDIRSVGSGNIGATNVFRILGKPAGIAVLTLDGLKGFAAAAWLTDAARTVFGMGMEQQDLLMVLAGVSAVIGHNYTCWLGFRGGKGIATSAGALAAMVPAALMIILGVWLILTMLTRFVSVGSIAASFSLPFASWITHESLTIIVATGAMGALAIYKHRANMQRLLLGTESRFGLQGKEALS